MTFPVLNPIFNDDGQTLCKQGKHNLEKSCQTQTEITLQHKRHETQHIDGKVLWTPYKCAVQEYQTIAAEHAFKIYLLRPTHVD